MIRRVAAALVAGTALLPAAASACPTCAVQAGDGVGRLVLIGFMIVSPLVIGGAAAHLIRRLQLSTETERGPE